MDDMPAGSQSSLREGNTRRLLVAVRTAGSLTQAEISRRTGLSPATVSNIVRELKDAGIVDVTPTASRGRRAQAVTLARGNGVVVGIDFGHRHLRVAVADLAHEVLAENSMPIVEHTAQWGVTEAERLVESLLEKVGHARDDVVAAGLGLPTPIDLATGEVGSWTILPGWVDVRPAEALSARLGMPIHVDNDANLGALGEFFWGAGAGARDVAYIKVSTGIGAGLIIEGRLYRGRAGTAGEIGHTSLDPDGRVCRCGNRGCLETLASVPVLLEALEHTHGRELSLDRVIMLAGSGDYGCRRVIADAGRHVGMAVANLCNLLSPQRIVVGGDLARAGEILLSPLRETVGRFAIPSAVAATSIVPGMLADRAEVLGALGLAIQESDPFGRPD